MEDLVYTQSLTKFYKDVRGIEDLTFQIGHRGATGILGPNGSGKTTLIRVILGVLEATSGEAAILGFDSRKDRGDIQQRVGYVPEFDSFIPDLTAQQFTTHMGRISGLAREEAIQRAHDSLYYVGLGEERHRKIEEFSAGMKQKVKLAQALVHDPPLIVVDEPTNGLDPQGRTEMLILLQDLVKDGGKSILFSSHLLPDVEQVCSHVTILYQGRLKTQGDLKALQAKDEVYLQVRVKDNAALLIKKLEKHDLNARLHEDTQMIEIPKKGNANDLHDLIISEINSANLQLRHLADRKAHLEEVFVDLFRED